MRLKFYALLLLFLLSGPFALGQRHHQEQWPELDTNALQGGADAPVLLSG